MNMYITMNVNGGGGERNIGISFINVKAKKVIEHYRRRKKDI